MKTFCRKTFPLESIQSSKETPDTVSRRFASMREGLLFSQKIFASVPGFRPSHSATWYCLIVSMTPFVFQLKTKRKQILKIYLLLVFYVNILPERGDKMSIENIFLEELRRIISERYRGYQTEIAKALGMKTTTFSNMMCGRRGMDEDTRRKIANFVGINYEAITASGNITQTKEMAPSTPDLLLEYDEPPAFIKVLKANQKLSAGNGLFVTDDRFTDHYHFRADWLHSVCQPNGAILMDVEGESMHPTIKDKDTILIDRMNTNFSDDKIFAVRYGDTVKVKRLRRNISGQVDVISDNNDKNQYKTETVNPEELQVLGRVVWLGRLV
jgi:phage repressor protein C with HTH and peptisase S24 domain